MKTIYFTFLLWIACLCFWQCNGDNGLPDNQPPSITELRADPDTIAVGESATISCVANDPDGNPLTYNWEGEPGKIEGSGSEVTWTAPDTTGVYTISCTVGDGSLSTSSSLKVVVIAKKEALSIESLKADPDTVLVNETTLLTCLVNEPDNSKVTYHWQSELGSFTGSGASVEWTAPDSPGVFTITCRVSDTDEGLDSTDVEIVVRALPLAQAGPDQEIQKHMVAFLDGSESKDPDGASLSYQWSFFSKPEGSTAVLSEEHSPTPSFIADVDGHYILQLIVRAGTIESKPDEVTVTAFTPPVSYKLHGLNFSPYMDGQDPNHGVQISEEQLRNRMARIAPYTQWIRTFGSTHGLEKSGELAHSMDLKAAVGAWLGRNRNANQKEIDNLIAAANAGQVDIAIVGSEVLLRKDLSVEQLIDYIQQVRNAIPGSIPVTTADICANLLSHPDLISAIDLVFFNQYPYWEGIPLDCGAASLHHCYQELEKMAQGKPVMVSETGWPSCGNEIGNALPSPENASRYFQNVNSWARANDVPTFYFGAFDELWKAAPEGPQGACWGIWDKDGQMKQGMQAVFDGQTMADNWSGHTIPGGQGTPEIEFTFVPEIRTFEKLKGKVRHVMPSEHKVAVYILVGRGWWTKPTFAQPLTSIACDGSWTTDITTGGIDERATKIAAFLVPNGYDPPLAGGSWDLPQELEEKSLAKVEVTRN